MVRLVNKLNLKKYRDAYAYVTQATKIYGEHCAHRDLTPHEISCITESIIDRENAICWGVDCAHVARYMDKDFDRYLSEASRSYDLLERLVKQIEPDADLPALREAREHIDAYRNNYYHPFETPRPGAAPRISEDSKSPAEPVS